MNAQTPNATAALQMSGGFNIPDPASVPRLEGKVSEAEWALRVQLAATYRLCAMHGWTDLVFTHISARLPDEANDKGEMEHRFLINPYGVMFDEMTASALIKIDMNGKICQDTPYFSTPQALPSTRRCMKRAKMRAALSTSIRLTAWRSRRRKKACADIRKWRCRSMMIWPITTMKASR